ADQIRRAREIADRYPAFHPELFVTEFNVLQGGPGDTSANGDSDTVSAAISLLTSIEGMQQERLDRAFLFELKDGTGPRDYWGRWGVLTNGGQPKPVYYALKAFQNRPPARLPTRLVHGPSDGTLGL